MVNDNIENIVAERADWGETTRDEVLKEEIVRELLYTEARNLSVGTELLPVQSMNRKQVEFAYPGHMTAEYPVAPDSTADRQRITWAEFSMRLRRGHVRYAISDDAKLDGLGGVQMDRTRRRASEALARRKDEEILEALRNATITENEDSIASGDEWNSDTAADGVIIDGLFEMWRDIVVNAPVQSMDTMNMSVVLPAEVWTEVNKLELINNLQQRVRDYLGQAFGFTLYPTKVGTFEDDQFDMQDLALMVLPGQDTAVHGELSAETAASQGVPLVENQRIFGEGEDFIVSQWFGTGIMEHESTNPGETPRVSVRTNVNANV